MAETVPSRLDVEGSRELLGVLPFEQGPGVLCRSLNPVSASRGPSLPTYWIKTFLPVAISSMHSSRRPVSARSSCSSDSMPPLK